MQRRVERVQPQTAVRTLVDVGARVEQLPRQHDLIFHARQIAGAAFRQKEQRGCFIASRRIVVGWLLWLLLLLVFRKSSSSNMRRGSIRDHSSSHDRVGVNVLAVEQDGERARGFANHFGGRADEFG